MSTTHTPTDGWAEFYAQPEWVEYAAWEAEVIAAGDGPQEPEPARPDPAALHPHIPHTPAHEAVEYAAIDTGRLTGVPAGPVPDFSALGNGEFRDGWGDHALAGLKKHGGGYHPTLGQLAMPMGTLSELTGIPVEELRRRLRAYTGYPYGQ